MSKEIVEVNFRGKAWTCASLHLPCNPAVKNAIYIVLCTKPKV